MKTFKQFNNNQVDNPFLDWKSSFGEIRNKNISESEEILSHTGDHISLYAGEDDDDYSRRQYMDAIHKHPDIDSKISSLSKEHGYVSDYTSTGSDDPKRGHASSGNMNAYLRNMMGDKTSRIYGGHSPEKVEDSIRNLSSVFTPERTNRKSIRTYSGVPHRINVSLSRLQPNRILHLPGFTSTSTSRDMAMQFSQGYADSVGERKFPKENEYAVINFHVHPETGLSVPTHSNYPYENEIILHHGTKVTYLGKEKKIDNKGFPYTEHHMIAHSDHLPLEYYPHDYG